MDRTRRKLLRAGTGALTLLAAAGGLRPGAAYAEVPAWNKAAFETHNMAETMKALGGGEAAQSKDIVFFQTPDIAENGAVVPVGISSNIPKTESIAILIEKNPNMLAANFDIPAGTDPTISTRVKMNQTSERLRSGQGRRQVLRGVQGSQGHARRLRRLTCQIR